MKLGLGWNEAVSAQVRNHQPAPLAFGCENLWPRIGCADAVNFNAHCVKIECERLTS